MRLIQAALAAAILFAPAAASAKDVILSFDGYCDVLTLKVTKKTVVGTDSAQCEAGYGAAIIGSVKGDGAAIGGVQFEAQPGVQFIIQMSYPFVTGGTWSLAYTTDGSKLTPFEHGTYTVEKDAAIVAPAAPRLTDKAR